MNFRSHKFSGVVAFLAILFLWTPLVMVAVNSLNSDTLLARWGGATLTWYRQAIESEDVREGLRSTIVIALCSTVLSLVLAVSGALWWRRASVFGRRLFDVLTYVRIILPEVVFAVAMFLLFTRFRLPLGLAAVVIGHTVWNSAFATLIVQARLVALDPTLEDAAADLGAGPGGVFRRVTVPALMPAIVAAGFLAFTFSFDDIVTSYFLAGSDIASPLPLVILSMIRQRIGPQINAIGILVMVTTVAGLAIGTLAARGSWRGLSTRGRAEPLRRDRGAR